MIGVAFDGTGYGTDGTIWGGEFLVAAGRLRARRPSRAGADAGGRGRHQAAVAHGGGLPGRGPAPQQPQDLDVVRRNQDRWAAVTAMARRGVNSPLTSSAGRLFDAAAALLGVRDAINYEGQAAMELEQLAEPREVGAYPAAIEAGRPFRVRGADLVHGATDDLAARGPAAVIAARFHNGVAALVEAGCLLMRDRYGLGTVALSGGVFQNLLLLDAAVSRLEARGFRVLLHARVPCNDGGISLGQAVVAAARDRL